MDLLIHQLQPELEIWVWPKSVRHPMWVNWLHGTYNNEYYIVYCLQIVCFTSLIPHTHTLFRAGYLTLITTLLSYSSVVMLTQLETPLAGTVDVCVQKNSGIVCDQVVIGKFKSKSWWRRLHFKPSFNFSIGCMLFRTISLQLNYFTNARNRHPCTVSNESFIHTYKKLFRK